MLSGLFIAIYNDNTNLIMFSLWLSLISVLLSFVTNKYSILVSDKITKRKLSQLSFITTFIFVFIYTQNAYFSILILIYQIAYYEILKSSTDSSVQVRSIKDYSKILAILITITVHIICMSPQLGLEVLLPYSPAISMTLVNLVHAD